MSAQFPWVRVVTLFVGTTALGIGIMYAVVPTPEQSYQAMAPDLRRKVDEARQYRLEHEKAARELLEAQTVSDKPLWANKGDKST